MPSDAARQIRGGLPPQDPGVCRKQRRKRCGSMPVRCQSGSTPSIAEIFAKIRPRAWNCEDIQSSRSGERSRLMTSQRVRETAM